MNSRAVRVGLAVSLAFGCIVIPSAPAAAATRVYAHQFNLHGAVVPDSDLEAIMVIAGEINAGRRPRGVSINEVCRWQFWRMRDQFMSGWGYQGGARYLRTNTNERCGAGDHASQGIALFLHGTAPLNYDSLGLYSTQDTTSVPRVAPSGYICARRQDSLLNIGFCGTHLAVASNYKDHQGYALYTNQLGWSLSGYPRIGLGDFNGKPSHWPWYYSDYHEADGAASGKRPTMDCSGSCQWKTADYIWSHRHYMASPSARLIDLTSDHHYYIGGINL